jgi:3-dehydroquinate synthase
MALPLKVQVDADNVWEALSKDKKREGQRLHFILLEQIGKAMIKSFSIHNLRPGIEYLERSNKN